MVGNGREVQRRSEEIQSLDDRVYALAREVSELRGDLKSYARETDVSEIKGQIRTWVIVAGLMATGLATGLATGVAVILRLVL